MGLRDAEQRAWGRGRTGRWDGEMVDMTKEEVEEVQQMKKQAAAAGNPIIGQSRNHRLRPLRKQSTFAERNNTFIRLNSVPAVTGY